MYTDTDIALDEWKRRQKEERQKRHNQETFSTVLKALENMGVLNVSRETLEAINKYKVGQKVYSVNCMGIEVYTIAYMEILQGVLVFKDRADMIRGTVNTTFENREDALDYYNKRYTAYMG